MDVSEVDLYWDSSAVSEHAVWFEECLCIGSWRCASIFSSAGTRLGTTSMRCNRASGNVGAVVLLCIQGLV
ncbi:hypothetical protein CHLRE_12g548955v5 [Chlamydomonas reinhardtii]|uniref:Uncharacterized protein n=1 Tax=Chlamydomonas reinhardtii TaxID=3055 RepID=A0A2K3D6B1_CHLRE|nr:uncharacterized protein CHLRE_12g548955v5 [Chlamydomonas reinhardtii]PNW76069.1 hypothetical protein CHLRE_12g548955v5 [Chlamydomonas reinhardtii]